MDTVLQMLRQCAPIFKAERLDNWKLHLQTVKEMLLMFHASGHFAYAKCAKIYLHDMMALEIEMEYEEYIRLSQEEFYTIRRSDKAWSGIWADMIIDLKHGRGVSAGVMTRYLLPMPTIFIIMQALETFPKKCIGIKQYFLGDEELTRHAFSSELSPFRLGLFDANGMRGKSNKVERYKQLTSNQLRSQSLINTFT